jgi:hypothetical protein
MLSGIENEPSEQIAVTFVDTVGQLHARMSELVTLAKLQEQSNEVVATNNSVMAGLMLSDREERDRLKGVALFLTVVVVFQAALDGFNSLDGMNVGRAIFAALGILGITWLASQLAYRRTARKSRSPKPDGDAAPPV